MRDGKLYKEISSVDDLELRLGLESLLDEASTEFPYRSPEVNGDPLQELLKLCRDRHFWFMKWFGVCERDELKEKP